MDDHREEQRVVVSAIASSSKSRVEYGKDQMNDG